MQAFTALPRAPWKFLSILAIAGAVQSPVQAGEFVTSIGPGSCAVWGPWSRGDESQPLRYQGPCVHGKAEGKGKATWLNPYRYKEGKEEVDVVWEGQYRQGVFIGETAFKGRLDAWRSNFVLSERGRIGETQAWWVHRAPSKGALNLCEIERVALVVPSGFALEDDAQVQSRMRAAHEAVVAACPSNAPFQAVDVVLWRAPLTADAKGEEPKALAKGAVVVDNGQAPEIRAYRNDASEAVRQRQAEAERAARRAQAREAFHRLSAQQGVHAWLTTALADKDPFKWQGKTVALNVRLERMLSPSVAWVTDADRSSYRYHGMLLKGVSSDTFGKQDTAVVVGQLEGRKKAAELGVSGSNETLEASILNVVHARPCEQRQCMDWFGWDVHKEMTWGEPFTAAP